MNKKHLIALGIVAVGILLAVLLVGLRDEPEREAPTQSAPVVQVVAVPWQSGAIEIRATGTVQAARETELSAQVAGQVVDVSPDLRAGGRVEAGDVLIQLDPADFENAVAQARAEVAEARVRVLQAEEESTLARREFERYQQVQQRQARAGTELSQPDRLAGEDAPVPNSGETEQPSALTLREPQLQAAEAALDRAEARLEDARLALKRTRLTAPFDGFVRTETVSEGDYLSPGRGVARIYASDTLEAVVPLTAEEASRIPTLWGEKGTPAEVIMDYGDQRYVWSAEVARVQAELDPSSRTLDVVLRVPEPFTGGRRLNTEPRFNPENAAGEINAPPLLVGTFIEARITGEQLENYLRVPRKSVRTDSELWVVGSNDRLRIVSVDLVQTLDNEAIVTLKSANDLTGLEELRVVTGEVRTVTDGMKIQPRAGDGLTTQAEQEKASVSADDA